MFNSVGSNSLPLRPVEDLSGEYKKELQAIAEVRGWKPPSGTPPNAETRALDAEIDRVAELRSAVYRAFKAGDNDKVIAYGRQMLSVISILEKATGFASAAPVGGGLFGGKRKTEQISIKFSWTEALRSGVKSSAYSIDLEKASILWNIAAAYSASGQATLTKGSGGDLDDSTLKSATQDFLRAAGVFAYMEANVVSFTFPYDVSAELNASVYPWLKEFMVAKAAVLVCETAKTKKMTPASLSKLAMAAAEKFEKVVAMCDGAYLKAFLAKNAPQHVDYCKSRVYFYSAIGSQCAAQGHASEEQYGLEIARLKQCLEFVTLGLKTSLAKNKMVSEEFDKISKVVKERLAIITKENESFYLMPIPSPAELGAIESRLLAKIADFAFPTEEESELSILTKASELGKLALASVPSEVKDFAPEPEFGPVGDDVNVEDLARLISMGFPEEQSKQALSKSKGNLAAAVEILQVAPAAVPVEKEKVPSDLERLQSMGFSAADGAEALAKGGSLPAAIDYLQKKDALPKPVVSVDLKSDVQAPGKVPAGPSKPEAGGGIFSKLWGGGSSGSKKDPPKKGVEDAKDADSSVVQQLVDMGYDPEDAAAAAVASGNKVSVAVHLLSQMPEKSPKKPEVAAKPESFVDAGAPVDKGLLTQIQAMGFKESQARTALQKSKGNLDQALELLMSGDVKEDEPVGFVSPVPAIAAVPAYEPPFEFAAAKPVVDPTPAFKPYVPSERDDGPLGILLAMGYEKERANAALLLSKNDVAAAIEFLGKAESPSRPKPDELKKVDPPKSGDKGKDKDKEKDKAKPKSGGGGVFGLFGRRKSVEPNEELLKNLMMMGYSEEWSRDALEKSKNDFGQALDLLSKRTEEEDKKRAEEEKRKKADLDKVAVEERTRLAFEALRREEEEKKKREDDRTRLAFEALRREEEEKRRRDEERRAQEASAASAAPPASSAESRAKDMFKIGQLMAMGFKREEVVAALMKANGNADAAIELLMASRK